MTYERSFQLALIHMLYLLRRIMKRSYKTPEFWRIIRRYEL